MLAMACVAVPRVLACAALAAVASGCASLGVVDDGTSVSWGKANRGGIANPARLPDDGDAYRVPARWSERGLRYGTDELVDLVIQVSRRIAMTWPDARMTVADLSPERGGRSRWHRSHQSGRDVDLVFFATDLAGRPVELEQMRRFGGDGVSIDDAELAEPRVVFDVPRNWSMVRAVVEHPGAAVQHVFVYEPLAQLMLDHARTIGEPESVVERARQLLKQPGDTAPHDDHLHVRILCSPADRAYGCRDYGTYVPPTKKLPKAGLVAWGAWPSPIQQLVFSPMPAMLALVGLPILP
jgi:penicillin-insensitive murein DD-endopeptidase